MFQAMPQTTLILSAASMFALFIWVVTEYTVDGWQNWKRRQLDEQAKKSAPADGPFPV